MTFKNNTRLLLVVVSLSSSSVKSRITQSLFDNGHTTAAIDQYTASSLNREPLPSGLDARQVLWAARHKCQVRVNTMLMNVSKHLRSEYGYNTLILIINRDFVIRLQNILPTLTDNPSGGIASSVADCIC